MNKITKIGESAVVLSKNGYNKENVKKAFDFLHTHNKRNLNLQELVDMYNELKGTNETAVGCKSCQINKYYMGIQNFYNFGLKTLLANGIIADEDELIDEGTNEPKEVENATERLKMAIEEIKSPMDDIIEAIEEATEEQPKKRGRKAKETAND